MSETVHFGRYLLERRLAMGGMAEVFLGKIEGPEGFQKQVVIKRVLPHLRDDERHVQMFLDEARLAARFNHPNLIQVYELANIDGQYCLSMEYIDGEDVAVILDECVRLNRHIPFGIAASIIAAAAEGLHYVHELRDDRGQPLNVVHRDISPANIIVTRGGGLKVVDFGIAQHSTATTETVAGTLKGKFSYMSPEQARGENVDRRSDIFSLGTILYELVTLKPCFNGNTQLEILNAVVNVERKEPREFRPDLPESLARIIERMHAVPRSSRYTSAADVKNDLRHFVASETKPSESDLAAFLANLFAKSERKTITRAHTAIVASDEIDVPEGFASPAVDIDADKYDQVITNKHRRKAATKPLTPRERSDFNDTKPVNRRTLRDVGVDALPMDDESTPVLARRTTGEVQHWPKTLIIIFTLFAVAAGGLIGVYRATLQSPSPTASQLSGTSSGGNDPKPEEEMGSAALQVFTEPAGAQVYVDGTLIEGRTPMTIDNLAAGVEHNVVVDLAGYEAFVKKIKPVDETMPSLMITLTPLKNVVQGQILVRTNPPGAAISIDSKPVNGMTPMTVTVSADTDHSIEARLAGYTAQSAKVRSVGGETVQIDIPLFLTAKDQDGFLTLDSDPKADIYIGDRKVGSTPIKGLQVASGTLLLELRNSRLGLNKTLRLDIAPGASVSRRVSFKKGQVIFDIRPWADVYLSGKKIGTTPMAPMNLYEGTYAVKLVNPDLGTEKVVQVAVRAGKTKKVVEKMK